MMTEPGTTPAVGRPEAPVCPEPCCAGKNGAPKPRWGSTWASALAGFIAGAAVATIILLPWLILGSKLVRHDRVAPPVVDTPMFEGETGEAPDEPVDAPQDDPAATEPMTAENGVN